MDEQKNESGFKRMGRFEAWLATKLERRALRRDGKQLLIVSVWPLIYLNLSDISLTRKGIAAMNFLEENPESTYADFENQWNQMWQK